MAIFSNQATLTYNGNSTNSNIAYGEIVDVLTATKTSVEGSYTVGELVTYVVALRNTGSAILNALSISDDLGGYDLNGTTVYPLTYEDGSAKLFIDGVLQPAPTVSVGPPLAVTGISIPGGADAVLVYQARVNSFANPGSTGTITNNATVNGTGISAPVVASEETTANVGPVLSVSKSITPTQVVDNDRVTYTFVLQNTGNQPLATTDSAVISDTFDPILTALNVVFEGVAWTEGVQYNYDETTGLFTTNPGQIVVPEASYSQDIETGEYTVVPGIATLTVIGTI